MATGSMAAEMSGNMTHYCTPLALALCLISGNAGAQDVGLAGIMGSKAMLMINGAEPQSVAIGQSLDGVKLEAAPLQPLVDDLALAVLAHVRGGAEPPEALRIFSDLFTPEPRSAPVS